MDVKCSHSKIEPRNCVKWLTKNRSQSLLQELFGSLRNGLCDVSKTLSMIICVEYVVLLILLWLLTSREVKLLRVYLGAFLLSVAISKRMGLRFWMRQWCVSSSWRAPFFVISLIRAIGFSYATVNSFVFWAGKVTKIFEAKVTMVNDLSTMISDCLWIEFWRNWLLLPRLGNYNLRI